MFDKDELKYLEQMEERIVARSRADMQVLVENFFQPKFELLAELIQGQGDKFAPKEQVTVLDERLTFDEKIMAAHTVQIEELKKSS